MLATILIQSLIYCGLLTAVLAVMSFGNPRVMLQKYPPEIQKAVAPKTETEKKQTLIYSLPFLLVIVGYPITSTWFICHQLHPTFAQVFVYIWILTSAFNLYDLLILDWLIFCTITPRFIIIKGSEGNQGYKNYRFHFTGFLKGIVITFVLSVILSGLVLLV
ncbi:hypothetical protein ACFGVR_03660 [Mucilaginibacter sp. AW1-3]